MNTYTDKYSGEKYSQADITTNLNITKQSIIDAQLEEFGFNFCVDCKELYENSNVPIPNEMQYRIFDCSHDKSIKDCKWDKEIERIWSKDNIHIRCRKHHLALDLLNIQT